MQCTGILARDERGHIIHGRNMVRETPGVKGRSGGVAAVTRLRSRPIKYFEVHPALLSLDSHNFSPARYIT